MKNVAELNIKRMPIDALAAHPRNPRVHPGPGSKEWDVLKRSLKSEYFDPIVFNKRNKMLVSGHLRTKVLKESGVTHADCVVVDYDEKTHCARMIAANKSIGKDNDKTLKDLLSDLDGEMGLEDMALTGYTEEELETMLVKESGRGGGEVAFTQELLEEHNYIVMYFDNPMDWKVAVEKFGLEVVKDLIPRKDQVRGIGRVLKGAEWLERIKGKGEE